MTSSFRFSCAVFLAASSLALAATGAMAAPPKREATLGGGKAAGGPIMSMAELRACVAQQSRLDAQRETVNKAQQQYASDGSALAQESAALKAELAVLDRTSREKVEAYVERAKAHDKRIDDYQAREPVVNAQVTALNAELASYAKACDGRRYLEDDYKDIKAGK